MRIKSFTNQSGKGVVELLLVMVILGILTTWAIMALGGSRDDMYRQNLARELKVNMERARFDAIKRRVSSVAEAATITFTSQTAFKVKYDLNQNGVLENIDEKLVDFGGKGLVQVKATNMTFPTTIRFDENGNATAVNSSGTVIEPLFIFCERLCDGPFTPENATVVYLSPTGTVSMMTGGSTVPTFTAPAVTNINTNLEINPLIRVQ
jgi:Tfp pilus assembly protein FimT